MTDTDPRPEDEPTTRPEDTAPEEPGPAAQEDLLPEDVAPAAAGDDALPEDAPSPERDAPEPAPAKTGERIAKVMSRAGIASRRDAERMILEGRVSVNGAVIRSPALDITASDRVVVDGKPMEAPQETRLWLYHKPVGLVTSEADEKGRQTVFDALPRDLPRVMTVGRLDLTSEGLLLLTNDGELKRRLELPATAWMRRYRVRVNGLPNELTFAPLRRGVEIDGEQFAPMEIEIDSQRGANAWLTVGIREGRNREIRRAMAHVGLTVNRLIRIGYGPFKLGDLEKNEVREVKRRVLRDQLGGLLPGREDEAAAERGAAGPSGGRSEARHGDKPARERWSGERRSTAARGEAGRDKPGARPPRAASAETGKRPFARRDGDSGAAPARRGTAVDRPERRDGGKPWSRGRTEGGKPEGSGRRGPSGPARGAGDAAKPWTRRGGRDAAEGAARRPGGADGPRPRRPSEAPKTGSGEGRPVRSHGPKDAKTYGRKPHDAKGRGPSRGPAGGSGGGSGGGRPRPSGPGGGRPPKGGGGSGGGSRGGSGPRRGS